MIEAAILGAGPSGLACAHELSNHDVSCVVVDRNENVGGLCRTVDCDGYLFDIGGHRFLSRSAEVNAIWQSVLGPELLKRRRKSSIYFNGQFYDYPLRPWDAVRKLGVLQTAHCGLSYLGAQMGNSREPESFEGWMTRRFGRRLYENFFKSYTEKVWGIPCSQLSSDWAAQRIQQLSLKKAVHHAFFPPKNGDVKTLTGEFLYPRRGPGQFCDALRGLCEGKGVKFDMNTEVVELRCSETEIKSAVIRRSGGREEVLQAKAFLCSLPLPVLARMIRPAVDKQILALAANLRFRHFISINLVYDLESIFDDNWLYVHTPEVKVGRIQNYKNWSPDLVPDPATTSLGLEYFVSKEDGLWQMGEEELVDYGVAELEKLGLAGRNKFIKGFVVKVSNAYPVYERNYRQAVSGLRAFLKRFRNLQVMGRAGLFRYNNSDHALLTGLYAARNLLGERHDLWSVDPDRAYIEM